MLEAYIEHYNEQTDRYITHDKILVAVLDVHADVTGIVMGSVP